MAAAIRYHDEHGHLRIPTDSEDTYGYRLGAFITGQRTAHHQSTLDPDWITELGRPRHDLGRPRSHLAGQPHRPRSLPRRTRPPRHPRHAPGGQFLVNQRGLARKELLDPEREAQLTALDPAWTLERPGLAPQTPPPAPPHRSWQPPRHAAPRHDGRRSEVRVLAAPPVHHWAPTRPRPERSPCSPRPDSQPSPAPRPQAHPFDRPPTTPPLLQTTRLATPGLRAVRPAPGSGSKRMASAS
ncbi:helicase associated domain-containing protein [Streptomyces anulatus]|uniref:helicase associated domain-containing protein n=1 Tax=Streptomyces anulatus TaxID=1892 RepID=UPI0036A4DD51